VTRRSWGFLGGGLLVALLLAGVVSNFASAHPDGLDSSLRQGCTVDAGGNITGGSCPAQRAKDHDLAGGPLADYGIKGVGNPYLSTGLSGVIGVLLTFAVGGGAFWLLRRRDPRVEDAGAEDPAAGAALGGGAVAGDAGGRADDAGAAATLPASADSAS
jgi:cobalt/nickel transport protein